MLTEEQQAALRAALAEPHPGGDQWCGRTVATWIRARWGRSVRRQSGWRILRHVGAHYLKPRPRHVQADPVAQAIFTARLRPLLREVATAFPHSAIELWTIDEHRIGLKPILHKAWRSLVDIAYPASGRTLFDLATSVSIPLFEAELMAFARQVEASPEKKIILVLDRAGWHTSLRLRVPDHVYLHFLPAHFQELQPAEHLWPLTNTPLVNRHVATIEELEETQAQRCVALQTQPALIRSTTLFHWWPKRLRKRHQLRRK
jgi:Winged helix-turn helix/DDE superfamily endonuclease